MHVWLFVVYKVYVVLTLLQKQKFVGILIDHYRRCRVGNYKALDREKGTCEQDQAINHFFFNLLQ